MQYKREPINKESLRSAVDLVTRVKDALGYDDLPPLSDYVDLPNWMRSLEEFLNDFSFWADDTLKRLNKCLETDAEIAVDEFEIKIIEPLTPRLRSAFAAVSVVGNILTLAIAMLLIVWLVKFADIDAFEKFGSPAEGWGVSWLLWTAPYAVIMQVLWKTSLSKRWKALEAFKFASCFVEFRKEFFRDPRVYGDGTLLIKSLGKAWVLTVLFQGVIFGLIQGVFSEEIGADGEMLGGLTAAVSLPSLFRLPIELLTLCTLSGAVNLFSDLSLVYSVEDVIKNDNPMSPDDEDPRSRAETLEDFELLTDEQITRQRALLTFGYHFITLGFLSIEALSMRSLYTSMLTLALGHYIMLKGIQRSTGQIT